MFTSGEEQELTDELENAFAGWRERVDHPDRYLEWPVQAAHLHLTYDIPKKRSCVVALRQAGASNDTIADILDRSKGTVSVHFSEFDNALSTAEDLLDVMSSHPLQDADLDSDNWLPLDRVSYTYTDTEEITGQRRIKLFVDRIGNAVEQEYLIVDRLERATGTPGEMETTITRSAVSGEDAVIDKLTRPFKHDIDHVGHLALVYNGFFDPKQSPSKYTSLRADRLGTLASRINGAPDAFVETLHR